MSAMPDHAAAPALSGLEIWPERGQKRLRYDRCDGNGLLQSRAIAYNNCEMDPLLKLALMVAFCPAASVLVFYLISRWRETNRGPTAEGVESTRRRPAGESMRRQLL